MILHQLQGGAPLKPGRYPVAVQRRGFARNERELKRKGPRPGAVKTLEVAVARTGGTLARRFFSEPGDFGLSNEIKEFKSRVFSTLVATEGLSLSLFIFQPPGGGPKFGQSIRGPVGPHHKLFRKFPRTFFTGASVSKKTPRNSGRGGVAGG